jgi:hypothetical protein
MSQNWAGSASMSCLVTAIIPTLASPARMPLLARAVASLGANEASVRVLCVVNGSLHAEDATQRLASMGAETIYNEPPSAPLASLAGRRAVDTPFYCFVDDDDEYLPGAIDHRLAVLSGNARAALVASNGYRCVDGRDSLALLHLADVPADPLAALFRENWLPSCGAVFRASAIDAGYFERPHPYFEWTWLAFRIAVAGMPVAVLDRPTFRIHDTPSSLSKSKAYRASDVALYRRMMQSPLPVPVRRMIRERLATALARDSVERLRENELRAAWQSHLQTLRMPGGWRYCSQTLRLVAASLRRRLPARSPQ